MASPSPPRVGILLSHCGGGGGAWTRWRTGYLVLAACMAVATVVGVACGDEGAKTAPAGSPPAVTPPASRTALVATDLVPDLSQLKFGRTTPERIPAQSLDIAFGVYQRTGNAPAQARVEVRVYPTEENAKGDFKAQAEGWKSPPPTLFGGDPKNVDLPTLTGFADAKAYIASNRDPSGNRVWTDIYRIGRVIVVAHVVAANEGDVTPVRQAVADAMKAGVK